MDLVVTSITNNANANQQKESERLPEFKDLHHAIEDLSTNIFTTLLHTQKTDKKKN